MKKYLISLFLFIFLLFPTKTKALENVNLYFFHSNSCVHCAQAKSCLDNIKDKYDYLEIYMYEVSDKENSKLKTKIFEKIDYSTTQTPFIMVGSKYFVGYNENVCYQLEDTIKYYSSFKHKDIVGEILGIVPEFVGEEKPNQTLSNKVKLPWLGEVDPKNVSLPIVAIILGLIDGFNPCAMWILLFLITILIGLKDRKKMWILGTTFLVTSALVYLFFMLAWLNITLKMKEVAILRIIIAAIALIAGTINLRSYFNSNESGCNVVKDSKRKKIINYIKKITSEKYFILAVLGIIGLAFMVNLIELACSAGLPLLFTQLLAINNLSKLMYGLNILIYILFFLFDDLIIFAIAMITFKVTGISTKYTKYSHLIGGIIMLIISALLLLKPEWLMFNF